MRDNDNMLSLLESLMPEPADKVARKIADDFRKRRIEKGLTREDIAKKSGVAVSNIARFEQKGLISLSNLIELAIALGYNLEIKSIFSEPKYSTMEELLQIRKNTGKKNGDLLPPMTYPQHRRLQRRARHFGQRYRTSETLRLH